jgi:hypothetical protein
MHVTDLSMPLTDHATISANAHTCVAALPAPVWISSAPSRSEQAETMAIDRWNSDGRVLDVDANLDAGMPRRSSGLKD